MCEIIFAGSSPVHPTKEERRIKMDNYDYYDEFDDIGEFNHLNPTFITNFDKGDELIYRQAIQKSGIKGLWIDESVGYEGDKSLHMSPKNDLTNFWKIFDTIKKSLER